MRAPRFPLQMPLRYRPIGSPRWEDGRTLNISRSGVLFLDRGEMRVDDRIEMAFALPVKGARTPVVCRGRVVRVASEAGDAPRAVAATISRYRMGPTRDVAA